MGDKSGIQWTDATWNPTTGCDRVSPGCANCYALTQARRNQAMAKARGVTNPAAPYMRDGDPKTSGPGFGLMVHEDRLTVPLGWKRPRRIFVDSMSDLFHPEVPDAFIDRAFAVMGIASRHTFQVLTKRPERMRAYAADPETPTRIGEATREFARPGYGPEGSFAASLFERSHMDAWEARLRADGVSRLPWTHPEFRWQVAWPLPNVWLGASIENARWRTRIDELRHTPAAVRFLSCEPLLGPLVGWRNDADMVGDPGADPHVANWHPVPPLDLTGIDWVIIGGESGSRARPMDLDWVRDIIAACRAQGAAPYVKQLGTVWAGQGHGGDPEAWPEDLRIREWPGERSSPIPHG